jgi:hypothetical protein
VGFEPSIPESDQPHTLPLDRRAYGICYFMELVSVLVHLGTVACCKSRFQLQRALIGISFYVHTNGQPIPVAALSKAGSNPAAVMMFLPCECFMLLQVEATATG